MKFVCKVCGYVYDEEKQAVPFAELPDSWVCPLCGAAKSDFELQGAAEEAATAKTAKAKLPAADDDMHKLSVGELAAVCSNLAKGCEKQYKREESELFLKLAKYFTDIAPAEETPEVYKIAELLQNDLENGYSEVKSTAGQMADRGALRVCTWGEKVTRILNTLLQKYEKDGEAFLANTEIWVCTVCGFVFVGDNAPELCPVCKVPSRKFEKIERRNS